MADMITPNFSVNEMSCRCGCGIAETDPEFMLMLQELKDQMLGPLMVCIGRRSDYHNDGVSAAKNKKNEVQTLGQASNILISGERAMLLFEKNCNQAMGKLAQDVEANTKAIEENGKAVAEMVNLLRAKVIQ